MISADLDTGANSNVPDKPASFLQSVFRSFTGQDARSGNRSRSNTGGNMHSDSADTNHSIAYAACLSSLSFFIHDGLICVDEADDPYNAICFFHPPNHTPTEQWEFTGPIVGAVRFMTSFANSPPKSIHLASSSIAVLCFDQYTVALKASKVLCSNALEACLRDLYNVFSLYYNDLKFVRKLCRDDDPEVALGRFKYNLAHIWTKLIGLVGPCKLLHPIAHIPHFMANEETEEQIYQFFACIIAIFSGFNRNTFGCLLSFDSQIVQSTFDVSLTRTLMLGSNLIRNMPQTAHVLPSSTRLPKSAFVRYAFASRTQLLESRVKLREQLKTLPPAAQMLLRRLAPSFVDSAFSPMKQQGPADSQFMPAPTEESSNSPGSAIMSKYFEFAWAMAGAHGSRPSTTSLDASFAGHLSRGQDLANQENADHWESRSSSMSSVAIDLNRLYSPLMDTNFRHPSDADNRSRSVSANEAWPSANFDQLWGSNSSSGRNFGRSPRRVRASTTMAPNNNFATPEPFGQLSSKLPHVLRSAEEEDEEDDDHPHEHYGRAVFASREDRAFSSANAASGYVAASSPAFGAIAESVRNAANRLSLATDELRREVDTGLRPNDLVTATGGTVVFSSNGFLDSGHSSYQGGETASLSDENDRESAADDDHVADTTANSDQHGRETRDSVVSPSSGAAHGSVSGLLGDSDTCEAVETVLYVQSHGPLSLIALLPNSPSFIKGENLRRLYDVLLPILADICSLLMHLNSEAAKSSQSEAVVVSFEPSRQRLHRLGLCRACNNDIRFDTQLFGIQRLFAKDPGIRNLQISDWTSHVKVTREAPQAKEADKMSDAMAPYRASSQPTAYTRHSYIKVRRNGCASSLIMLPSAD